MKKKILCLICLAQFCLSAFASRVISMFPVSAQSSQLMPTGDGVAGTVTFTFTTLDVTQNQNITITLFNETISGTVGLFNASGLTSAWTALFGGNNLFATGQTLSRPTPTQTIAVNSTQVSNSAIFAMTAAFKTNGLAVLYSGNPASSNFAIQQNTCGNIVGPPVVNAPNNTVCTMVGQWNFSSTITVDNDLGAVIGAMFITSFPYGGTVSGQTQSDRYNLPINGGRPF